MIHREGDYFEEDQKRKRKWKMWGMTRCEFDLYILMDYVLCPRVWRKTVPDCGTLWGEAPAPDVQYWNYSRTNGNLDKITGRRNKLIIEQLDRRMVYKIHGYMLCILTCIHDRWWDQHSFKYANVNNMNMNIRGTFFPPSPQSFLDSLPVICILHTFFPSHVRVCNFWGKNIFAFQPCFLFFCFCLPPPVVLSLYKHFQILWYPFLFPLFLVFYPLSFFPLLLGIFVLISNTWGYYRPRWVVRQ